MLPLFEDYLDRLQALHIDIQQAIEGVPQEALDWSPMPDMNSLAVLVMHATGAERYWIGDVAGRDPSGRNRDAEFQVRDLDAAALTARLAATLAHSRVVLEGLTPTDLEARRVSPRDGREFSVAWALAHTLEHTAIHLGHMQIIRQWWDFRSEKPGFFEKPGF